jgi:hypothetical protein
MKSPYEQLANAIIKEQEKIIGPLATTEANKVNGITITADQLTIKGEGFEVIKALVNQYTQLFGDASIEACKDAVRPLLPQLKNVNIPSFLT